MALHVMVNHSANKVPTTATSSSSWATLSDYSVKYILYAKSHKITHTMAFVVLVVEHWMKREIAYVWSGGVSLYIQFKNINYERQNKHPQK